MYIELITFSRLIRLPNEVFLVINHDIHIQIKKQTSIRPLMKTQQNKSQMKRNFKI